ncbi:hypothetical protein ACLQ8Z_17505 [Bordetella hinzii]|uniref:Transglycosylase SLT domain-containing protein n=2 Tax=Bordetella hinzii TaxID=103855 RepID=A0AAN1VG66_9BORD|nr:hypothetical protein [Bordetella hinzii]AKQ56837.1 hypothetical protein ACR54_03547 [Bordetella hinzii]AKQ61304.1 hypothetical protein ACR55_03460 [Bordetella hinzii]AZW17714.1 hypothetical protein CS347_13525 [Bordetella hinzii]KCB23949.1 lytic transglycosylase family protein [Bordetella hinzii OH87 BAL007II]KCB28716.1 lytic transglycosylase family protein [Bordetella hinzii L60]
MERCLALLLCLLALAGCASTRPPGDPENICAIFREKPDWHDAALKVQEKWGAPVQVPIAMMYQESSFRHDALPPRYYFLGFIPWGRVSSAYGYAQAKDETWSDYKREAGGWFSSRDNFADSLDFMGWYMSKTQRINGISKWDAYGQYLNYHEGWTGYRNRSYERKAWLQRVARQVQARAERFGAQYKQCERELGRGGWLF